MNEALYTINILWKDDTEETIIICPQSMVLGIVSGLALMLIERIKIIPFEDAL